MLIAYARVSVDTQTHDLQLDALRAAGAERIFTETASGAQRDRPELAQALSHCREGDCLLVYSLSRLARSVRQLVETVEDLAARGIGFRSLTEAIDTTSPAGRLTFHIFAAVAQCERELTVERVKAGLQAARARGKVGGRRPVMTPAKAKAAQAMLQAGDLSVQEICRQLGVSSTSLYRAFPRAKGDAPGANWEAPRLARIPPALAPSSRLVSSR